MRPLLIEIGTEEIPARFIPIGIKALKNSVIKLLNDSFIDFSGIHEFATPRRLAILVEGVSEKQKDRNIELIGPPKKIAFDEQGKFTKAAIGFAKAQNVDVKDLKVIKKAHGEYISVIKEEKGRDTKEILEELLPKVITSIQFPKSMRWGRSKLRFARPIRWITALFGADVIAFEIDGLKSSNTTRGHRFLSPEPLEIKDPTTYPDILSDNFVIANHHERKDIILRQIRDTEKTMNFRIHEDNELLETVNFLVEYPNVILGDFDAEYLSLPKELLITTMKSHQRYFSVEDKNGNLLPYFIVVSNTRSENNEIIKKGAERVLKARLEDARFYYHEDQKKPLWDYVERLKEVTFQETLGSLYDKVNRIAFICSFIADILNLKNKEKLIRASMLSKADLVTGIVREFPELQGYMGMVYAKNSGEDDEIALAIYEHYLPRFSGDILPSSEISTITSLADKIDNIVSFFFLGLIPTGSEDPFALRRQAIAVLNILKHKDYPLKLDLLIEKALGGIESYPPARNQLKTKILSFFRQRLEGMLLEEGYSHDLIAAILSEGVLDIKDIERRIKILSKLIKSPDFPELLTAAKRVYNILGEIKTGKLNINLLTEPAEKELHHTLTYVQERLIETDFQALFELKDPINTFFDKVLVMDKNPEIRENRLALLSSVKKLFDILGDFSKILSPS
jgi:glycyl-tRNA synthetase beta chain